ncbi:hypothetical protein ACQCSU_21135 [Pseudarthrobacter sp. O4]|uniref:hypothetical protein n=1 Tax=Pseudarthrobacter sp. O4 TaxID=3418417 RepID=UPI003CE6E6C1
MASFGRPIEGRTAQRLVAGMVERAREYNADAGKPLYVERLRLFGSCLIPAIDPPGDLELTFGLRIPDQALIRAYTQSSHSAHSWLELPGRKPELIQILRNRSAAINITLENIDHVTDCSRAVYDIQDEAGAVPPPGTIANQPSP